MPQSILGVVLPITSRDDVPASVAEEREEPEAQRILVADDEPAFREMFRLILEKDGHRTSLAANGAEALEILRSDHEKLSLVILDLKMPEVDGLSVLKELQTMAPGLPVLVTTGYASPEEKKLAMARGARKILEKPYRVNDLRNALAEVLRADGNGQRLVDRLQPDPGLVGHVAEQLREHLVELGSLFLGRGP